MNPTQDNPDVPKVLVQLIDYSNQFNIPLNLPHFVVIGMQNAGKTSFIQCFSRKAIGFSLDAMATFCPVIYNFQYDEGSVDDKFFFNQQPVLGAGQKTACEVLVDITQKHMQDTQRAHGGSISLEPVTVTIISADIINFTFVDLPGVNLKEANMAKSIEGVIRHYIAKPNAYVLGIITSNTEIHINHETTYIVDLCKAAGMPQDKLSERLMFIGTKADRIMNDFMRLDSDVLEQKLQQEEANGCDYYIVCMTPPDANNAPPAVDKMTHEQKAEHYRHVERIEELYFQSTIGARVSRELMHKRFGLTNVRNNMRRKLQTSFAAAVPQVKATLNARQDYLERELVAELNKQEQLAKPVDSQLLNHVDEFVSTLLALMNSRVLSPKKDGHEPLRMHAFQLSTYGRTYEQDLDSIAERLRLLGAQITDCCMSPDAIFKSLGSYGEKCLVFTSTLKSKQQGINSITRGRHVLEYSTFMCKFDELRNSYSDEEILGWARVSQRGVMDVDNPVLEMVKRALNNGANGIDWFRAFLSGMMSRNCDDVEASFQASCPKDKQRLKLYSLASRYCMKYIEKECLEPMTQRWYSTLRLYSSRCPISLSIKAMMLFFACPLEDILIDIPDCTAPIALQPVQPVAEATINGGPLSEVIAEMEALVDKVLDQYHEGLRNAAPGEITASIDVESIRQELIQFFQPLHVGDFEINGIFGCILSKGASEANVKDIGKNALLKVAKPPPPPQTQKDHKYVLTPEGKADMWQQAQQVSEMLARMREQAMNIGGRGVLNVGHIVESMFAGPRRTTPGNHDPDHSRRFAQELFLVVLTRFLFDFECSYNVNFVEHFESRDAELTISKFIKESIKGERAGQEPCPEYQQLMDEVQQEKLTNDANIEKIRKEIEHIHKMKFHFAAM